MVLVLAGVAFRALREPLATSSPPPACRDVVGLEEGDAVRLACPDDPAVRACAGRGRPLRPGDRHRDCASVGPLPGAVLRMHGLPVDVNRATADDLRAIEGLGASIARRIVEARAEGPFCDPSDLTRVHGIGERKSTVYAEALSFVDPRCP